MRCDQVIRNFSEQWKALKDRKEDEMDVQKTTKNLNVVRWAEAFEDCLNQKLGVRPIPLKHVTRDDAAPSVVAPNLAADMLHSNEHGSAKREPVMRATHNHPHLQSEI